MANRRLIWSDIVENQQSTTNDMRKNFETKLPKQALVTLRKPCILQSRNKKKSPPGGQFENDVAEYR